LRLNREAIDIVSLGIRTLAKSESQVKLDEKLKPRMTSIKRNRRMFSDLSESELQKIIEEKSENSDDENESLSILNFCYFT
jgi:hypothetical protein